MDVLVSYNAEAAYQMKMGRFTQKLKEYCAFAEHIHCLNPASVTGREKEGDRWVERVDGKQIQHYYVQSVKAAAESAKHEPQQAKLQF